MNKRSKKLKQNIAIIDITHYKDYDTSVFQVQNCL